MLRAFKEAAFYLQYQQEQPEKKACAALVFSVSKYHEMQSFRNLKQNRHEAFS